MDKTKQLLLKIKSSVEQSDPGASIILFGSYARGDNTANSDLDLLILLNKDKVSSSDEKKCKISIIRN